MTERTTRASGGPIERSSIELKLRIEVQPSRADVEDAKQECSITLRAQHLERERVARPAALSPMEAGRSYRIPRSSLLTSPS